jgi:hypothetical protein
MLDVVLLQAPRLPLTAAKQAQPETAHGPGARFMRFRHAAMHMRQCAHGLASDTCSGEGG